MITKKIGTRALIITFGLGLGLLLLELGLRLMPGLLPLEIHPQLAQKLALIPVGQPRFLAEYRALWEADDDVRERMKPGIDTVIHDNPEYPVWPIRTNSLGLGPRGYRDTPSTGPPYALILGDSFGFGVGVAEEAVWSEQLERELGLPFVNLSQAGASSLQQARIYARDGQQLAAQVVFWLYFQNDLKDNLRFAQWLQPEQVIPQAVRQPTRPCSGAIHHVLKRTSLVYELPLYWQNTCEYSASTPSPVYQGDGLDLKFCLDHDICDLTVQNRMLADGWPLTRQAVLDTAALSDAAGATLVIVIVPSKEQVYAGQFRQVADFLPSDYEVDRLVEPMRQFCRETQRPCLDLTGAFRADVGRGPQRYFRTDIHWNADGQDLVGQTIKAYLDQENLLP